MQRSNDEVPLYGLQAASPDQLHDELWSRPLRKYIVLLTAPDPNFSGGLAWKVIRL
jgi:hypothetical protein